MSFVITIDGPAAAGKSTTARAVARSLGFLYLDTGALYRALALRVRDAAVPIEHEAELERIVGEAEISLGGSPDHPEVWLDGVEVSPRIRTPEISELASRLAALPAVRRRLTETQRRLRNHGPLVGEGRDLGTVVFADAEVKIYLDADLETRARRRHLELERRSIAMPIAEVRAELERRDERDRTRADSPLRVAPGAVVLDTSGLGIEQQTARVLEVVRRHPAFPAAAGGASAAGPS